jgi:acyl carrier protein
MDQLTTIRELLAGILGVSADRITAQTVQGDLPEWDSVNHLNLILGIEDAFGVRLDVDDMTQLRSVDAILKYVERACPSS